MTYVAYCAIAPGDRNGVFVMFIVVFWLDQQLLADYRRPNRFIYMISFHYAYCLVPVTGHVHVHFLLYYGCVWYMTGLLK